MGAGPAAQQRAVSRTLAELLDRWQGGALSFFAAFCGYCRAMGTGEFPPQDCIAEQLYRFGKGLAGMNPLRLRDLLCMDLLACRRGGRLPAFLRREDPDFGRVAPLLRAGRAQRALDGIEDPRAQFSRGLLRFCILYSGVGCCGGGRTLLFADHRRADPVSGQYPLLPLPLENFSFAVRVRRTNPPSGRSSDFAAASHAAGRRAVILHRVFVFPSLSLQRGDFLLPRRLFFWESIPFLLFC